jgi:arginyl-tRNA synthetase
LELEKKEIELNKIITSLSSSLVNVEFRYRELIGKESDFPEGGYEGLYIIDIAKLIIKEHGKSLNTKDPIFKDFAEKTIFYI